MSRKKKKSGNKKPTKLEIVLLVTAILNLIKALIELARDLIE